MMHGFLFYKRAERMLNDHFSRLRGLERILPLFAKTGLQRDQMATRSM
jgi:hypothetical protein